MVVVGREEHLHLGWLFAAGVEERLHVGGIVFQVAALLLQRGAGQVGVREILVCDEDAAEELVFESDPIQRFGDFFRFRARLAQVVRAFPFDFIGEGGVAALEVEAFFLLAGHFVPFNVHRLYRGQEEPFQSLGLDFEVHHVGVGQEPVVEIHRAAVGGQKPHGERGVGGIHGSEEEVARLDVFHLSGQHELQARVFFVEQRDHAALLVLVFLQLGFLHCASPRVERQAHQFVFHHYGFCLAAAVGVEERCRVLRGADGGGYFGFFPGFLVGFGSLHGHGLDGVLSVHGLNFGLARAAPIAEPDEDGRDEDESDNRVFIHCVSCD